MTDDWITVNVPPASRQEDQHVRDLATIEGILADGSVSAAESLILRQALGREWARTNGLSPGFQRVPAPFTYTTVVDTEGDRHNVGIEWPDDPADPSMRHEGQPVGGGSAGPGLGALALLGLGFMFLRGRRR